MYLEEEEIVMAVRKLGKAAGINRMKAWKHGGIEIRRMLIDLIRHVWECGSIPSE